MKKNEDYIKETELRKAQNYNARMNLWNESKKDLVYEPIGCIAFVVIFFVVCAILGLIIGLIVEPEFFKY